MLVVGWAFKIKTPLSILCGKDNLSPKYPAPQLIYPAPSLAISILNKPSKILKSCRTLASMLHSLKNILKSTSHAPTFFDTTHATTLLKFLNVKLFMENLSSICFTSRRWLPGFILKHTFYPKGICWRTLLHCIPINVEPKSIFPQTSEKL